MKKNALLVICVILGACTSPSPQPNNPSNVIPESQAPTMITVPTITQPGVVNTVRVISSESEMLIVSLNPTEVNISSPDGIQREQISNDRMKVAAISPDGKRIAYLSDEFINILDIGTRQIKKINSNSLDSVMGGMGWSPNGEEIGFDCFSKETEVSEVCLMDVEKGSLHILTNSIQFGAQRNSKDGVRFGNWNSDGTKIVFLTSLVPQSSGYGRRIIQVLNITNGKVQTVIDENDTQDIIRFGKPSISPDGNTILFSAKSGSHYAIFRINIDGSHLERVTPPSDLFDISNPVWSPDGTSFVAFAPIQNQRIIDGVPTLFSKTGEMLGQLDFKGGLVVSWINTSN